MDNTKNISTDLFYKIRSRFSGLKLGAETGEITIKPEDAVFFDFNYMENNVPIGHVSISLAEEGSMKVYFSHNITEKMNHEQKRNWYNFLKELRSFAKRRLLNFDPRDIAKDNLDQRDYSFLSQNAKSNKTIGESIMSESNLYGSKNVSYQKLMDTRLIIKHSKQLNDDMSKGSRSRNISALFVENSDGERFKYPFIHLAGARAMQRHVANGGFPYDDLGKSITEMSHEIAQLKSFGNYVVRNDLMNSDTNGIVEKSNMQLESLRDQLGKLSKQHHYENYKNNFKAKDSLEIPESVIEDYKNKFTVRNFKEDIANVFPVLYRLMNEQGLGYHDIVDIANTKPNQEKSKFAKVNHMQQFEDWAYMLGEESPIQSSDSDKQSIAIKELNDLVSDKLEVGVDGQNAIESLKGIIEDPELDVEIEKLAKEDSTSCAIPLIKQWVEAKVPDLLNQIQWADDESDNHNNNTQDDQEQDSNDDNQSPEEEPTEDSDFRPTKRKLADLQELAEFIHSFYDAEKNAFPRGPEGVLSMVGKKYGKHAEHIARQMVERMAPDQSLSNHDHELDRLKKLSGIALD